MQTLLVGLGCGGVLDLLPGVAVWKPRAALAEARWPWAESAALSGLMKAAEGRPQRCEGSLALAESAALSGLRRRGGGARGFWSVGAGRKPHSESADYAALGGAGDGRAGGEAVGVGRF